MTAAAAPSRRVFGPRARVPGECSQCGAAITIALNRVDVKNYCPACRKAAEKAWSRTQWNKPDYRARRYARQSERRRAARVLVTPAFPPVPGRPGFVMAPCSECSAPVETAAFRAGQRRLCDACRDAAKRKRESERYRVYTAAKREREPVIAPVKVHHNYAKPLTLISIPDDSWPAGGTLALETWLGMVEDKKYHMDGARWRDRAGQIYVAAGGQIVKEAA